MPCEFEACTMNPFQGAPASQFILYPIAAVDAIPTTPQFTIENDLALATGGGNWPGVVMSYAPGGSAGGSVWYQYVLAQPDGTGSEFERSLSLSGTDVIQETWNSGGTDTHFNLNGASFDIRIRELAGQGQLTGSNLTVDPSLLPPLPWPDTVGIVSATGSTQANAAPITTTQALVQSSNATRGIRLPAWSAGVIWLAVGTGTSMNLYPPTGGNLNRGAVDAPMTLNVPGGVGQLRTYLCVSYIGDSSGGAWQVFDLGQTGAGAATTLVNSFNGRSGVVTLTSGDVTGALGYTPGTSSFSGAFGDLTGIPTTLSGYGITDAQPLDADLTALAALAGTDTLYYRSGAATWSPVTVGTGLTFSGGTLAATAPTLASAQTVGGSFTITGATGVYQATGISLTLPTAGTYLVTAQVRGELQPGAAGTHRILAKLRNTTDSADVANSETLVTLMSVSGQLLDTTATLSALVTVTGTKTLEIYAARTGTAWTVSQIVSDTNGRTKMNYIQVG